MNWRDGTTHDLLYTPQNIGREFVTALCGERVHVTECYGLRSLTCKPCKTARIREILKAKRLGRGLGLLSVGG